MAVTVNRLQDLDGLRDRVTEAIDEQQHDQVARLLITGARQMLQEGWEPARRSELAALLGQHQQFGYARRIYRGLYDGDRSDARLRERYARSVYKDLELPSPRRYDRALEILREGGERKAWSAEALGLAGAVYKRRWQAEAKFEDLQQSYEHYFAGWERAGDPMRTYCGINAAFVLDLLDGDSDGKARAIRQQIVDELQGRELDMWDTASLAEAQLGIGELEAARRSLAAYAGCGPSGWERESTASQLADLARLAELGGARKGASVSQFAGSDAAELLQGLGDPDALIRRAYLGKVGLALSGGGFRASLFHIGVLARLAEHDVLRSVEVLSCVSGGSIVGAHYYLLLRELLQKTPDEEIGAGEYVKLVQRLSEDFLRGVQDNPRVRLTGNLVDNWKMAARSSYSRTDRMAELFEELFYGRIAGARDGAWRMTDLFVNPHGRPTGFSPRYENWERRSKVPVLVLNATTLNTGHSWQFTASWMGEPPDSVDERIDANARLRRMYYGDAPPPFDKQAPRLAEAVAASACVPGLFPPIRLADLYDGTTVELVDGGVHDNQGVASLIEQECAVVLVSDASGQMGERPTPGRALLSVATRSNSILQSRVRGAQLVDLGRRQRAGSLRRLMVVHLKKGLPAEPKDWWIPPEDCPEPYDRHLDERAAAEVTSENDYDIAVDVQRALADVRTDLDSFSDVEAYALMAAGYQMAGRELEKALPDLPVAVDERPDWIFAAMIPRLAGPLAADAELDVALGVADERFGKGFRAWWHRRSRGSARGGGFLKAGKRVAGGAGRVVAAPVRAVVAAPVAVIGAVGTRAYLETFGRLRRRRR